MLCVPAAAAAPCCAAAVSDLCVKCHMPTHVQRVPHVLLAAGADDEAS
jgi:hypothetical protein